MDGHIIQDYMSSVIEIFSQPRFMLFLRRTKRIQLKTGNTWMTIQKNVSTNGKNISLVNSFTETLRIENFRIFSIDNVPVSDNAFSQAGISMRKSERTNNQGEKETYFIHLETNGEKGTEILGVPDRIASADKTEISFAVEFNPDGGIQLLDRDTSSLYAYLPMNEQRFCFPFYINADFIPNSNREEINTENPWNAYLFYCIGESIVRMVKSFASSKNPNYLYLLPDEELDSKSIETKLLSTAFNRSYQRSLESEAFILNDLDCLARQDEVIIDNSGLSVLIDNDVFLKILGSKKRIVSSDINTSILKKPLFRLVEEIDSPDILEMLQNMDSLKLFCNNLSKENLNGLFKWLSDIPDLAKEIIAKLPCFSDMEGIIISYEDLKDADSIILTDKIIQIKPILKKLGINVYENICSQLFEFPLPSEKEIFNLIVNQINKVNEIIEEYNTAFRLANEIDWDIYLPEIHCIIKRLRKANLFYKEHEDTLALYYKSLDETDEDMKDYVYDQLYNIDIPNLINLQIESIKLSAEEKLSLLNLFMSFKGVDEATRSGIKMFKNACGQVMPLFDMVAFKEDAPEWLYPYMICEEECFTEVQNLLIKENDEFDKVIWEHRENINISIDELFLYNPNSNEAYLQQLIKKAKCNSDLYKITKLVADDTTSTKNKFLNKIDDIHLSSRKHYGRDSNESKVISLALEVLDKPEEFASKIFYDDICITQYSVADEVKCSYDVSGVTKTVTFSLAKLLPVYKDFSEGLKNVKELFDIEGIEKLFINKDKSHQSIANEIKELLNISSGTWTPGTGNPDQYLFLVYYFKEEMRYTSTWVMPITLCEQPQDFVSNLMDCMFENRIVLSSSPFAYRFHNQISNKYFSNDYILDSERLPKQVEQWADNEEKIQYLKDNGVKSDNSKLIRLRKAFMQNREIEVEKEEISLELAKNILSFVEDGLCPYTGNNQVAFIVWIYENLPKCVFPSIDLESLISNSQEWESEKYVEWKGSTNKHIFLVNEKMPYKLQIYGKTIVNFNEQYSWYDKTNKNIYLSKLKSIDDLLFELIPTCPGFSLRDYDFLCREGKVSISQEQFEEIENLKEQLRRQEEKISKLESLQEKSFQSHSQDIVSDFESSQFANAVKEFMGEGFDMPYDKVKQEHIITRYRCLIFLKNLYGLSASFDEKAFIQSKTYQTIALMDGTEVHVQGAKNGIWYVSPYVWKDIIDSNRWICLCTGNSDSDFKVISDREGLQTLANDTNSVVIRVRGDEMTDNMETLSRVFPGTFGGGQVQLLLKLHDTPNKDINQMFDAAFNNDSSYDDL